VRGNNLCLIIFKKNRLNIFLFIFFIFSIHLFANERENMSQDKLNEYNRQKITFQVKEKFDALYPQNIKKFYFYQNTKLFGLDEFIDITQDPYLLKTKEKIKKIKLGGFTATGVLGGVTLAFFIPSLIFVILQTNSPDPNSQPFDNAYIITGISTFSMFIVSFVGVLVSLIVTFSLLYKYQYNEKAVRQAVERYNEKIRKKLGILPDISMKQNKLSLGFSISL
jgi:hypothetical protein